MTTIAWDGKALAADRRAVRGGGFHHEVNKLFVSTRFVFGGCGEYSDAVRVARWLETSVDPFNALGDAPTCEDDLGGIIVDLSNGRAYAIGGKRPALALIAEPMFACGSGRDFALAAMALGKSAKQAVELAARFDVYTGDKVDVVMVTRGR